MPPEKLRTVKSHHGEPAYMSLIFNNKEQSRPDSKKQKNEGESQAFPAGNPPSFVKECCLPQYLCPVFSSSALVSGLLSIAFQA